MTDDADATDSADAGGSSRADEFRADLAELKLADPAASSERRALQAGIALMVVGVALVALGWYGASGVSEVWKEIPYLISGGIGGLTVTVIGAALYLRASLARQQRLVLVRMLQEQRTQTDRLVAALEGSS
ncbi:MAG: hypothetical protein JNK12_02785 [Acidimicrobiales bacterium]|nr:hypothetical protein [Acidimicrobiales bacterium]